MVLKPIHEQQTYFYFYHLFHEMTVGPFVCHTCLCVHSIMSLSCPLDLYGYPQKLKIGKIEAVFLQF